MSEYQVTMKLSGKALTDFLDNAGTVDVIITAIPANAGGGAEDAPTDNWRPTATRKPRTRRKKTVDVLQAAAE